MKKLSYVFAAVGIVLMICAFFGRFIDSPTVFGGVMHGGMSASHVMMGADTFLLLAILAYLYKKD
jgi:hypothetical protein